MMHNLYSPLDPDIKGENTFSVRLCTAIIVKCSKPIEFSGHLLQRYVMLIIWGSIMEGM